MVGHDVVVRVMGEIVSRVQESVGLVGLVSDELAVVEGRGSCFWKMVGHWLSVR